MRDLTRLLEPESIVIVGASERNPRAINSVRSLQDADVDLFLVNPHRSEIFGQRAYPSIAEIPREVDAALLLVGADDALAALEQANDRVAGAVMIAATPSDDVTSTRQRADALARRGLSIIGPNCNGYVNMSDGIRMTGTPAQLPMRRGTIGFVTHSGAMLGTAGVMADQRGVGFSKLVSTGNEWDVDAADAISYLANDASTHVVCLVVETVRRPGPFFDAMSRATEAGKPVIVLRLARTGRAQRIAQSHTGAVLTDSRLLDLAFEQAGAILVRDLEEMFDRASGFAQVDPRNRALGEIAILTGTGGGAGLTMDIATDEGLALPELDRLQPSVSEVIPGASVMNPLDVTGYVIGDPGLMRHALAPYLADPEVGTIWLQWPLSDAMREFGSAVVDTFLDEARRSPKLFVLGAVEDTPRTAWLDEVCLADNIVAGRGVRGTVRALETMQRFVRQQRTAPIGGAEPAISVEPPASADLASNGELTFLSFGAAMQRLERAGVPVAAYHLIGAQDEILAPTFAGPYVVKLADVAHRTEYSAVRVGVSATELDATVAELRELARTELLPETIAVQQLIESQGEAFIGVQATSDLGVGVVGGIGGIWVEHFADDSVGGIAPISPAHVSSMASRLRQNPLVAGGRGGVAWPTKTFAELVRSAGAAALDAQEWTQDIDINPMILGPDGFRAVDCLWIVRAPTLETR